jgi:hypothetical protein
VEEHDGYVNPDMVVNVAFAANGRSEILLANGDKILVEGIPADVALKIEGVYHE